MNQQHTRPEQYIHNSDPIKANQQNEQSPNGSAVRLVYGISPATKQMLMSAAIPNAIHYTPFKSDIDPQNFVYSQSLLCSKCSSFLNLHCEVYEKKNIWICCICKNQNHLPPGISKYVTQEQTYDLTNYSTQKTIIRQQKLYLFVIDLCISEKQMKAIKNSLIQFIKFKTQQKYEGASIVNRVGLITYSKFVYCYQLSSQMNTVVCISPDNNYNSEGMEKLLGLKLQQSQANRDKYFVNLKTDADKLLKRIQKIKAEGSILNDSNPLTRCRAKRSSGQALNIALSINEYLSQQCRIINFVGGPCTHGFGRTVSTDFKHQMRSIKQYQNEENLLYYHTAKAFYNSLKPKIQGTRSIIDLFIFSVEETGLTEMYEFIKNTGSLIVLGEQFSGQQKIFQNSFKKAYIQYQQNEMACSLTNSCVVSVSCSSDILLNGSFGRCKPLPVSVKGKQYVSEKQIGFGQTNSWFVGGMNCYNTLTFTYDLSSSKASQSIYYIQLKTMHQDYWGFKKTRVTTVKGQFSTNIAIIADNFDQDAAVVLVSRWYLHRIQFEPKTNLRQWIDKMLIKWTLFFSKYIKNNFQSFNLTEKTKFFPQYIYHFRRNPIFRRTGLSLDELTYHIHCLNTETVQHCLTIIQPALLSYNIEQPYPSPVRLEQQEMKNSVILLLDSYFNVLLWYGQNIEYWEKQQYHKKVQYQHVKFLLQAPQEDIKYLIKSRFPYPGFYKTSTGHSKQRFLKSKVSPIANEQQSQNTITDDKSFKCFMNALIQIIISGKAQ